MNVYAFVKVQSVLKLLEIKKRRNIKSKIQPEGTRRNDAGKVLRAVLNYKNIFLEKRNFFDGSGWTDQWKRAILLE